MPLLLPCHSPLIIAGAIFCDIDAAITHAADTPLPLRHYAIITLPPFSLTLLMLPLMITPPLFYDAAIFHYAITPLLMIRLMLHYIDAIDITHYAIDIDDYADAIDY